MVDDLIPAVRASAERLGIDPSDLLTALSYETAGKLSPGVWGGKGGQYLGLIQFSPENQKKYGVTPDQTAAQQMGAVESYLRDRGVKPGHGLLDVYSSINAGRPGLYSRSDAANGGAPGTVADKVASMAPHRMRANAMLGLGGDAQAATPTAAAPAGAAAIPLSLAPAAGGAEADDPGLTAALAGLAAISKQPDAEPAIAAPQMMALDPIRYPTPPAINHAVPPGLARARALAQAMSRSRYGVKHV